MLSKKSYKFRLKPRRKHETLCVQFAGARRWIINRGLHQRKTAWEQEKHRITLFDQNNELAVLKEQEETAWLKEVHSQVLQQGLQDLESAHQHFFRRVQKGEKPGYPRFKRRGESDSFRYPQGVKVKDDLVWLPKIGWVRFKKTREIEGIIKQTTILCKAGKWYVSFSCEVECEMTQVEPQDVLGIDLGLESFATTVSLNSESIVPNPRFLKRDLSYLRIVSKQLSRKVLRSNNRRKFKAKLTAFHAKVKNRRKDFLHKLSTLLVKSHDAIAVESLNVKSLLGNTIKSLARSISDAGWRQFL